MIFIFVIIATLVFGSFLYRSVRTKSEAHALFFIRLPDASFVKGKLNDGFTGYVLCLDAIRYPTSREDMERISKWMKGAGYEFLAFDAPSVLSKDWTIGEDLKVEYIPTLISVKKGMSNDKSILIRTTDPDLIKKVKNFVTSVEGKLVS